MYKKRQNLQEYLQLEKEMKGVELLELDHDWYLIEEPNQNHKNDDLM